MNLFRDICSQFKSRNHSLYNEAIPPEKHKLPKKFYVTINSGGWWVTKITIDPPSLDDAKIGDYVILYESTEIKQLKNLIPTWEIPSDPAISIN